MTDIYLSSSDRNALADFCAGFANVIGIQPGRAAVPAQTLDDGTETAAEPAAGDTSQFYACIRTDLDLSLPENIALCDPTVGAQVCGVWS